MVYVIRKFYYEMRKRVVATFSRHHTVVFHMAGGTTIIARNVREVKMTRDNTTGSYSGYEIEWHYRYHPTMFTLSIPAIQAVTME